MAWRICLIGGLLALGVPAIAWLEQSALLLLLVAVVAVAVIAPFFWPDKRASDHRPLPSGQETKATYCKRLGGFQLVQDLVVRMLGNFISTQAMMLRLAELQDRGSMQDEHASLAKAFRTVKCRANAKPCSEMFRGFELAR